MLDKRTFTAVVRIMVIVFYVAALIYALLKVSGSKFDIKDMLSIPLAVMFHAVTVEIDKNAIELIGTLFLIAGGTLGVVGFYNRSESLSFQVVFSGFLILGGMRMKKSINESAFIELLSKMLDALSRAVGAIRRKDDDKHE